MQIENEFTVEAPVDDLWAYLLDVERIAPCMPGAELTETVDERTWKGKVNMKLGPVSLSFAGTVSMQERDDEEHRVKLQAKGMEQRGKGAANASVTSWLEPAGDATTVKMSADIQLTGAVAQLSRGLLPEVSKRLTAQFAECVHETILADHAAAPAADAGTPDTPGSPEGPSPSSDTAPPAAPASATPSTVSAPSGERTAANPRPPIVTKPIGGIGLGLAAVWAAIVNAIRRLFGHR